MQIIPQRIYTYGDGLPAYKSGEWPGSKPCHFNSSKLILKPIKILKKNFPFVILSISHKNILKNTNLKKE